MDTMAQLFIGVAIWLVWYIMSKDRGEKEPHSALWAAVGFGLLSLVVAGIVEALFLPVDIVTTKNLSGSELINVSLAIGVIEEVCKFLPLALFIYKKSYFNEYNDGVLYFAIAGLGFGVPENILYTLDGGVGTGVVRLIMTPFFHAATTAFVGYFLIRMKLHHGNVAGVLGALGLMILVHAAYDYGLLSTSLGLIGVSVLLTFGLNIALLVLVSMARKRDELARRNQLSAPVGRQMVARTALAGLHNQLPIPLGIPGPTLAAPQQSSGLAVAALVAGVLAASLAIIPLVGLALGVPALIMGAFVYRHQQGLALGAIITGSIGTLGGVAWVLVIIAAVLS